MSRDEIAKEITVALLSQLQGLSPTHLSAGTIDFGKIAGDIFATVYDAVNKAIDKK